MPLPPIASAASAAAVSASTHAVASTASASASPPVSASPTSCRIMQDIDRFSKALDNIIEAEGSYVEEFDGRHGHRRATQKAVSGGALIMTREGALTEQALEGMKTLETAWIGLTKPI